MESQKHTEANRRNAQTSTVPKAEASEPAHRFASISAFRPPKKRIFTLCVTPLSTP